MEFLQAALAGDPVSATQVTRMAHEHGLTAKAVRADLGASFALIRIGGVFDVVASQERGTSRD
jgi:hypothetical protein